MDKISKALKKLSAKERKAVELLLRNIQKGTLESMDIKKLKDREDIFRVRKGDIRIIYQRRDEKTFILAIERRNEKTYKNI
ncbi:MAG TPA: hypothetical protein VGA53_00385 [Candidatus Paceibacterota bacterium]